MMGTADISRRAEADERASASLGMLGMRRLEIINRLEVSLIETEYALADAQPEICDARANALQRSALRKANAAIKLALLALSDSKAQQVFSAIEALH